MNIKNKKDISTLVGIIIIVIAAIVFVGGAFTYQYYAIKNWESKNITGLINTQVSLAQTANWKIFSDSQLPFTFKYPSSWASPTKSLLSTKVDISFGEGLFLEYGTRYNQNLGRPQTFDEIAYQVGGSVAQKRNFTIDSKKAVEITCRSDACPQALVDVILVSGDANGNNIFISNNQGKVDPQLFKTIISTFKFISQVPVSNQNLQYSKHISVHIETIEYKTVCGEMIWPAVRNMSDKNILGKIEQILGFNNITGITKQEYCAGFTGSDYQINYDKNNLLSISFFTSWMGAYPSEATINYVINLANGETIKLSDIFYQNKISDLVNLLNTKLQANIQQELDFVRQQNPSGQGSQCSEETVNQGLQSGKEYDPNYGKFTEQNLTLSNNLNGEIPQYASFKIIPSGIEFVYDFGFAHAIQACEPDGKIALTYDQLKNYINLNGLLGNEIK